MGLLDGINLNSSGGGGGLLDNLLQTLQYNTSAESPDAAQLRASPGWGPNPFTGAAASPLMQGSADMLGRGAYPVAPPMFAPRPIAQDQNNGPTLYPTIAQDQPTSGVPTIAPLDPREGQPLTDTERQLMALARPGAAMPPPQAAPAAPVAPPAVASDAADPIAIGKYKMPRIGAADDFEPEDAAVPAAAKPAQGTLPAAAQPATVPSFLQPQGSGGGGFGGAARGAMANMQGGPLGMLAGAVGGAMGLGQGSEAQVKQQNLKAQYDALVPALIQAGKTPQQAQSMALLAVMNPEAAKTLIPEALSNKQKWGEIGSDSFGNKTMGWIDETNQTINGKSAAAEGAAGSPMGFLAPGVKQVDSTLTGKDYLAQFSPEVQAGVQNYIDGKSTPTGNPRKGFTQTVKMIAQKVGADTGESVDDTTYAARRTMRNQLSSSAPSSLGGQINIGNTAAGHLADLSQKAVELGNYDTGIAPLSAMVNGVRGLGTDQAAKMEALKGAAQHYGQEITKFYAGSPGGTAERDRFIESVNGARSPKELAAILATEGELMRSRLDALGGQIKGVLGEEGSKQYPVLRSDGEAGLKKVAENVAILKGGQSAPTAASNGKPAVVTQNGHTYTLQADGSYK